MMMKVRALSSEGRMTAIMLNGLPISPSPRFHGQSGILSRCLRRPGILQDSCLVLLYIIGFRQVSSPGRFEVITKCLGCSPKMPF